MSLLYELVAAHRNNGYEQEGIPVIDHTYCATAANDTFNEETLLGKSGPQERAS